MMKPLEITGGGLGGDIANKYISDIANKSTSEVEYTSNIANKSTPGVEDT